MVMISHRQVKWLVVSFDDKRCATIAEGNSTQLQFKWQNEIKP